MTLQTTHYDQLTSLFVSWCPGTDILSFAAYQTQTSIDENAHLVVKRGDMHFFYEIRQQLRDCLTPLSKEVENNLLAIDRDQHDIIYLEKLATTYNEITTYLSTGFDKVLARFEGITYNIEPPKKPVLQKLQDSKGLGVQIFDEPLDPFWNEYQLEEYLVMA